MGTGGLPANFTFRGAGTSGQTAAVNVEVLAQLFAGSSRNIQCASPDGLRPGMASLAHPLWTFSTAQKSIPGYASASTTSTRAPDLQLIQILTGKRTRRSGSVGGEHHVTVIRHVRVTACDQLSVISIISVYGELRSRSLSDAL